MSEIIFLSDVRVSFPTLVECKAHAKPTAQNPNPQKYFSADFLLEPNDPQWQECWKQINATAQEKWAEHGPAVLQMINNDRKMRAGEKARKRSILRPCGRGMVTRGKSTSPVTAGEQDGQPQMIRADGNAVDPSNTMECQTLARKIYGGCRVNAAIRFWPQNNDNGRGVRCDLFAIQFARDDEAFGDGATDASDLFKPVAGVRAASVLRELLCLRSQLQRPLVSRLLPRHKGCLLPRSPPTPGYLVRSWVVIEFDD